MCDRVYDMRGAICDTHVRRYVGKIFYDEGTEPTEEDTAGFDAGEFIVEGLAATNNNFVCRRVVRTERGPEGVDGREEFDMCYVIGRIREYEEE